MGETDVTRRNGECDLFLLDKHTASSDLLYQ